MNPGLKELDIQKTSEQTMFQFIDLNHQATDVDTELSKGLTSIPKYIPSFFIYDARGSLLFEQICELPEYYLTRKESQILSDHAEKIAFFLKSGGAIVELGSGNAQKTRMIIDECLKQHHEIHYIPIDISKEMLIQSSKNLCEAYDDLKVVACCGSYFDGLDVLKTIKQQKLVLWLGSSIGNFKKNEAAKFLKKLKFHINPQDGILVGIDLRKKPEVLEDAYNDSQGITSQYHLNCLDRFNREYGADFIKNNFYHRSEYDDASGYINAYIISKYDQRVNVEGLGLTIFFKKNEKVLNELSCKYNYTEINRLAEEAGVSLVKQWFDRDHYFSLNPFY